MCGAAGGATEGGMAVPPTGEGSEGAGKGSLFSGMPGLDLTVDLQKQDEQKQASGPNNINTAPSQNLLTRETA